MYCIDLLTRFPAVSALPMPVPDPPNLQTVRQSIRTEPEDAWDPHGRRQCDSRSRVQHQVVCRWRVPAAAHHRRIERHEAPSS